MSGDVSRQTALHLALQSGQEAVVGCLLEFTSDQGLGGTMLDTGVDKLQVCANILFGKKMTHFINFGKKMPLMDHVLSFF